MLSFHAFIISHLYIIAQADEQREHVEVCAEGGVIVQNLATRVSEDGGAALIADYGHDGTKTDTFRVSILLMNSSFSLGLWFSQFEATPTSCPVTLGVWGQMCLGVIDEPNLVHLPFKPADKGCVCFCKSNLA